MAAHQVEDQPNTDNVDGGEGMQAKKLQTPSLDLLEPLLDENNHKLSLKQKNLLHLMVQHYEILNKGNSLSQFDRKIAFNWIALIFTAFTVSLSSFIFGYVSVEASLIIDPTSDPNPGAFNSKERGLSTFAMGSLIPSCPIIGACIGSLSLFLSYTSPKFIYVQKLSRKTTLLLTNIPVIIGCIICFSVEINSTTFPWLLTFGLITKGIGFGAASIIAPIILAEIAPTPIRQFITMFHQLFVIFGILMAAIVALPLIHIEHGWRYISIIPAIPAMLQLILCGIIPNTPRWLIANGEYEKAEKIIHRMYGHGNGENDENEQAAKEEFEIMYKHIMDEDDDNDGRSRGESMQNEGKYKWMKALVICIMMNMFQQWTGINVVVYRSQTVLKDLKFDKNVFIAIIILYLLFFIATISCIVCIKRKYFTKKTLLYIGTCLMLLMLSFLGLINTVYTGKTSLIDQLSMSQTPLYVIGFGISLGPFVWEMNTEAFPFENRIKFASICVFIQWLCNAMLSLSVDGLIDTFLNKRIAYLYFIFCGMIILSIIFINKCVPKTTGKSLENAVKMYM